MNFILRNIKKYYVLVSKIYDIKIYDILNFTVKLYITAETGRVKLYEEKVYVVY